MDAANQELALALVQANGALVTAIQIINNAAKAVGMPGKVAIILSLVLGIAGAYLTISHDPSVFIISGIIVGGIELGIYKAQEAYTTANIQREPEKVGLQEFQPDLVVKAEGKPDVVVDSPMTVEPKKVKK